MPPSKAQAIIIAERRAKAVQLRLAGVDYEHIAAQLGYSSRQFAREDVHRAHLAALKELRESTEEMRDQDLGRLDRLQAAFWGPALTGDTKAGDMVLKILIQRAKMMGYAGSIKVEISTIDQIDAEIQALRERLALNAAPEPKAIEA